VITPKEQSELANGKNAPPPADAAKWRWGRWRGLPLEVRVEDAIILTLSAVIAVIVLLTIWSLVLKVVAILFSLGAISATDPAIFQNIFGMIFIVIIALEFRRTLLVITERQQSIVHVRAVILVAMLAIVRKLIIFDLTSGGSGELFALAATILALGGVYWLVRDVDKRGST
jgi:uncharacterized membrane protein (DUF373 family)